MTTRVQTASEVLAKLTAYDRDDRPLNVEEIRNVVSVLDPLVRACKNVCMNVPRDRIPNWLCNDWMTLKNLL